MAAQPSILAYRIAWTEELAGYSPWGCKELDMTEHTQIHTFEDEEMGRGLRVQVA